MLECEGRPGWIQRGEIHTDALTHGADCVADGASEALRSAADRVGHAAQDAAAGLLLVRHGGL